MKVQVSILLALLLGGCASLREHAKVREVWYPDPLSNAVPLGVDVNGDRASVQLWNSFLSQVVSQNGEVDYRQAMIHRPLLNAWIKKIADLPFAELGRYEQVAVCINAYNAFTIDLLLQNPGTESILDLPAYLRELPKWELAGERVNRDDVIHLLRSGYADPRYHFALARGTVDGGRLHASAYTGDHLMAQLDAQAQQFLSAPENVSYSAEPKTLTLNRVLDWYRIDFGSEEQVVKFVQNHLKMDVEIDHVRYRKYNAALNGSW